jgi:hypothetical protein
MSKIGFMVMLNSLRDNNDAEEVLKRSIGKTISKIEIQTKEIDVGIPADLDELRLTFTDQKTLIIYDNGQTCSEHRYMELQDEDISQYEDSSLLSVETQTIDCEWDDEYGGTKECCFLKINTSKGSFTIANYNKHNGYYGGFSISLREE